MSDQRFHVLVIRDAERGAAEATVTCPRRNAPMPLLVCEACIDCVHVSRPSNPEAWVLVCVADAPAAPKEGPRPPPKEDSFSEACPAE